MGKLGRYKVDKQEFLNQHKLRTRNGIRVIFNEEFFLGTDISVVNKSITIAELLKYYVPRQQKDGQIHIAPIEESIIDPTILPVTVRQATTNPDAWDLELEDRKLLATTADFRPIPLAYDLTTKQGVVLDGNHTLVNFLHFAEYKTNDAISVHIVIGHNMRDLCPDLYIVNRSVAFMRQATI